jgi:hypothetical protein
MDIILKSDRMRLDMCNINLQNLSRVAISYTSSNRALRFFGESSKPSRERRHGLKVFFTPTEIETLIVVSALLLIERPHKGVRCDNRKGKTYQAHCTCCTLCATDYPGPSVHKRKHRLPREHESSECS